MITISENNLIEKTNTNRTRQRTLVNNKQYNQEIVSSQYQNFACHSNNFVFQVLAEVPV